MNDRLYIEKILDFCDVPQLFIARDAFDTLYLCLLYEDEPSCQYTAIRISGDRLQSFLSGNLDLRELFENPETPFEFFDVEYKDEAYFMKAHEAACVGEERLPLSGYRMQGNEQEAETATAEAPSFLDMQGILKGCGNHVADRQLLDEYLEEKYGV